MDHFLTMRSFVEVVKKGSYTKAATFLGTSRALVSRHILDLEERLQVRLLNRTTRSITLTEQGRDYYEFCERILREIEETEAAISGSMREAQGSLAIVAPKWIGNYEIADAVTAFSLEYPEISVKLSLGGMAPNAYDFIERGFDVALHTRRIPDSLIRAKLIAQIAFVLCAAPAYLEQAPRLEGPEDLALHKGLIQSNDPVWRFERNGEIYKPRIRQAFSSNTYLVLRKAALKGLGVAMLPLPLVRDDLTAGTLVQVLPDQEIEERPLFAAFAPGPVTPQKVRLFIDFLAQWFRHHPI
ncbi:Transcriptional regulator [Rubellimicrobium thermophilum DSM 16684]|uniref:Transcriptional regulator n=1 Tax=Rubellimicrobium thermophilum DSM 16684 TaxID=1123069 RepID=S9S9E5_9RHOB|nr:LysR family transcriptional regulator [Rubellimicrobium thermophilum]EPX82889.1 Transcriptional regulator [Rubellimicrobium thermophilum DSM 16684]